MRLKSKLSYTSPMRRWTDRIRALADDLWELGRKKEADDMHSYATKKEKERGDPLEIEWSSDLWEILPRVGDEKEAYANERLLSAGPVALTIRTKVPSKWRFVDLETGDVWKAKPEGGFTRAGNL